MYKLIAKILWKIAGISPELGNLVMDVLGEERYFEIGCIARNCRYYIDAIGTGDGDKIPIRALLPIHEKYYMGHWITQSIQEATGIPCDDWIDDLNLVKIHAKSVRELRKMEKKFKDINPDWVTIYYQYGIY